jgi:hypothetical protein
MKKILFAIIFFFLTSYANATTYYISASGNDENVGTSPDRSWKTINKINDVAKDNRFLDGDRILFKCGDVFNSSGGSTEALGSDGSSVNWGTLRGLTIGSYGNGDKPKLDSNSIFCPIQINGRYKLSNLTIRNLDLSGGKSTNSKQARIEVKEVNSLIIDGIFIDGGGDAAGNHESGIKVFNSIGTIIIKNCNIFNLGPSPINQKSEDNGDIQGIVVKRQVNRRGPTEVHISGNKVYNCRSDALQIGGLGGKPNSPDSSKKTFIYNNVFYNNGENCIDSKQSYYVNIYNNKFYKSDGERFFGGGAELILVHTSPSWKSEGGGCGTHYVYHNQLLSSTNGSGIFWAGVNFSDSSANFPHMAYENQIENCYPGIWVGKNDDAGTKVSNNLIKGIWVSTPSSFYDNSLLRVQGDNAIVSNNTIFNNSPNIRFGIVVKDSDNAIFKYNIIWHNSKLSEAFPFYWSGGQANASVLEYNCWFSPNNQNRVNFDGKKYSISQLDNWIKLGHIGEIFGDPLFKNHEAGDYSLDSLSPCRLDGIIMGSTITQTQPKDPHNEKIILNAPKNLKLRQGGS